MKLKRAHRMFGYGIALVSLTACAEANTVDSILTSKIELAEGYGQYGPAGTPLPDSMGARVLDQYGNPLKDATVTWRVVGGRGNVSPSSSTTGSDGIARTQWTLGTRVNEFDSLFAVTSRHDSVVFTALTSPQQENITGVATGSISTCAAGDQHSICWGNGGNGALGNPLDSALTPSPVLTMQHFASIGAGLRFACGLTAQGAAYCWGDNTNGQLGIGVGGYGTSTNVPTAVVGDHVFTQLGVGELHVCGLAEGNSTYCWGDNSSGQLGIGSSDPYMNIHATPLRIADTLALVTIGARARRTCALDAAGKAYCWGYNIPSNPFLVSNTTTFHTLSVGFYHACGMTDSGPYCFGANGYGQLGDGTTSGNGPVPVNTDKTFTSVFAGNGISCGLTASGAAWCWGNNFYGELGNGSTRDGDFPYTSPQQVVGELSFSTLSLGDRHVCGLAGGQIYCWGDNGYGQVGDGTKTRRTVPTLVF